MDVWINSKVPQELADKVREYAKKNYSSASQVVRTALKQYLEKEEASTPKEKV